MQLFVDDDQKLVWQIVVCVAAAAAMNLGRGRMTPHGALGVGASWEYARALTPGWAVIEVTRWFLQCRGN